MSAWSGAPDEQRPDPGELTLPSDLPEDLAGIRKLLQAVDGELARHGRERAATEHRTAIAHLRTRFDERFESLARAHEAAAGLRRITTPRDLLTQAPAALCQGTGLRRALISTIRDGTLVPVAAHFSDDPDAAEDALATLIDQPVRIEHHIVEADVMRRRRATLVTNVEVNARVDRRLAAVMRWRAYVAAPLLSGASVIGMVHADRAAERPLDVLDREVLWEFSSVLSQIHESAELRRTLRHEREELRRFLEWLNARSVSLADAPITFAAYAGAAEQPAPVITAEPLPSAGPRDDRLVFAGLLTRRELDVLRLLADGGTNKTIADTLVLSETTVKFHVNSILRKLRVANRAEAVARYLGLLGVTGG